MMHLGIDLGTSGVKAVLTGADGSLLAQATAPLMVSTPHPLWSEQDPAAWWNATVKATRLLGAAHDLSAVRAIGLAGQMHGAVLLDSSGQVLRPAMLWNDGRSGAECPELEAIEPNSRGITGNLAMPGFTAPKLLWVRRHEPELFTRTARVLLPKDWLRLQMTGEAISDMSDASGTLWLDVGHRRWSPEMLAATGLSERQMPRLVEGTAAGGCLRPEAAAALGLRAAIPVAGGGGDNAAGAAGIGCVAPGDAFVSLGTSGVIFVSDPGFLPDPARTVHAFCHCLPGSWHRMSVILSAGASLAWFAAISGADEATLLAEAEREQPRDRPVFLPYLSGERTPHNNPDASGVFFGLTGGTTRAAMTLAVLEGVAFALADGLDALEARGGRIAELTAIGGGSRSALWLRIIAAAMQRTLLTAEGSDVGPALGAARLARVCSGDASAKETFVKPAVTARFDPDPALVETLLTRRARYRRLYPALQPLFSSPEIAP